MSLDVTFNPSATINWNGGESLWDRLAKAPTRIVLDIGTSIILQFIIANEQQEEQGLLPPRAHCCLLNQYLKNLLLVVLGRLRRMDRMHYSLLFSTSNRA